jgi:hypothetical protein
VKYRSMSTPAISRGYRSFLQAYQPKNAIVITKDFIAAEQFENVTVNFIPLERLPNLFSFINL